MCMHIHVPQNSGLFLSLHSFGQRESKSAARGQERAAREQGKSERYVHVFAVVTLLGRYWRCWEAIVLYENVL